LPSASLALIAPPLPTGTPNFLATAPSSSASRVKGSLWTFLNSWWFLTLSPLMPTTSTPLSASLAASSRKPQACLVQPPVRSAGVGACGAEAGGLVGAAAGGAGGVDGTPTGPLADVPPRLPVLGWVVYRRGAGGPATHLEVRFFLPGRGRPIGRAMYGTGWGK